MKGELNRVRRRNAKVNPINAFCTTILKRGEVFHDCRGRPYTRINMGVKKYPNPLWNSSMPAINQFINIMSYTIVRGAISTQGTTNEK